MAPAKAPLGRRRAALTAKLPSSVNETTQNILIFKHPDHSEFFDPQSQTRLRKNRGLE
jgi:hypothetical protein